MPQQITDDRKKQMRQNIIKHRQTLFQYLESINDTVLKPKIKLNSSNSEKLNLNTNSKKKPKLKNELETNLNTSSKQIPRLGKFKEESIELYSENSDDFLSVESNEEWFSSYSTSDEIDADSRRRPAKQGINKWSDEKKNDYVHDVDVIIINHLKDVEIKANPSPSSSLTLEKPKLVNENCSTRFRAPVDRDLHNAKERECRERIRKMFMDLGDHCSHLDNSRRVPSKHSILVAAKKECEMQKSLESQLLTEKAIWMHSNEMLRDKLRIIRDSIVNNVV